MRRLPEDIEAEALLLSTLCQPGAEMAAIQECSVLVEEDFHFPIHRLIFKALRELVQSDAEFSIVALKDGLERSGSLAKVGGMTGLSDALDKGEVGNPRVLTNILREKRRARELIAFGYRVHDQAYSLPAQEVLAFAGSELARISQANPESEIRQAYECTDEVLAQVLDQMEGRFTRGTTLHSWPRLNALTKGFQPGSLIVLAARPGIGKTALVLNWLLRAAMNDRRAAIFSLEMPKGELLQRLIADKAGVDVREMVSRRDMESFQLFAQAKAEVDELPIHISDKATITVPEIVAGTDRLIAKHGDLGLVVVDYLQLITSPSGAKNSTETLRIGEMTRGLKLLAKDRQIPVILLSQLNREVEKRSGNKPQLSDLRDSGSIEQDADMVMFIHRRMEEENAELIIAKHRNGPVMTLPLAFRPGLTRYIELERSTHTPYPNADDDYAGGYEHAG